MEYTVSPTRGKPLPAPSRLPPPGVLASPASTGLRPNGKASDKSSAAERHEAFTTALRGNPRAQAFVDTTLAFGSLSFRAVELPPPPPAVSALRTGCRRFRRAVFRLLMPWTWLDGSSPSTRVVARSCVLACSLFGGFVCLAYALHRLPAWDAGGSTITYAAVAALVTTAVVLRIARRCHNTAAALRRWRSSRRTSCARVCGNLCTQELSDVLDVVRGICSVGVVGASGAVWRSLILSGLFFALFLMLADVLHAQPAAGGGATAAYTSSTAPFLLALTIAFYAVYAACVSRPEDDMSAPAEKRHRRAIIRSSFGATCGFLFLLCLAYVLHNRPGP